MSFNEIVNECRTIHQFDAQGSVEDEIVREALELSLLAPNHKLTFPWKYFWIGPETREKLAGIAITKIKMSQNSEVSEAERLSILNRYMSPSHLIVFCCKRDSNEFVFKENYATLACSVQIFALSLARHQVGYKWSTGGVTTDNKTYDILNIDVNKFEITGFLWVGKALKEAGLRNRPKIEDVLVKLV